MTLKIPKIGVQKFSKPARDAAMSSAASNLYRFGEFTLAPQGRMLRKGEEAVPLTPKAFDALLLLIQNAGRTVSKDELMEAIWPGSFVEESNLTQTIFMVRKALEETAERRYILTVQGQGYQFLVPVTEAAEGEWEAGTPVAPSTASHGREPELPSQFRSLRYERSAAIALAVVVLIGIGGFTVSHWRSRKVLAEQSGRIMLAVLPFQNLTGDAGQEYISDGLTEEMLTQLGNLNPQRMGVIARTSVMHYKDAHIPLDQIGRELHVEYVLEGSVRRESERLRITAQLIQVKDQTHVWARQYDRELKDLLPLEGEVAQEIAQEIQLTFDGGKGAADQAGIQMQSSEGYDLYLKGLYFFNKRTPTDLQVAIQYFEQAAAKDPASARAYAGLAKGYEILSEYSNQTELGLTLKARTAAARALQIDENSSEAHTALALIVQNHDWDWERSEKEFRRAIELNPNDATAHHWYAEHLMWRGRFDEALDQSERAHQLDPLSLIIAADNGAILYFSRNYDAAIEKWRSVQDMDPSFMRAHLIVGAYVEKGMFGEAAAENERLRPTISDAAYWGWRAYIQGRARQLPEAHQAIGKLLGIEKSGPIDSVAMAQAFAGMGEKEQAVAWLEKASAQRSSGLTSLKVDPAYDVLRGEPRFEDLLRRVGLE
jgi:TolB-like protein/DNA-binding winged helix-turn-helix (wHTH) protein/Flp pilus assembly protein TadD